MSDLNLAKLRRLLRSEIKEKSASELFQDLTNAVQQPKEDLQSFLMCLLNIRQKVLFVAQESDSKLKANTALIQLLFLQTLESGMQSENIRTRLRPVLEKQNVLDEEIIHQLSLSVAGEEDRQKRLQHAGLTKQARVTKLEMEDDERSRNGERLSAKLEQKQKGDNEQIVLAGNESLIRDMVTLSQNVGRQSYAEKIQTQREEKGKNRQYSCKSCRGKGDGKNCNHCFKCGSTDHIANGCKKVETKGLIRKTGSSHNWGASSG